MTIPQVINNQVSTSSFLFFSLQYFSSRVNQCRSVKGTRSKWRGFVRYASLLENMTKIKGELILVQDYSKVFMYVAQGFRIYSKT